MNRLILKEHHPTIEFAAQELQHAFKQMGITSQQYNIQLGCFTDFSIKATGDNPELDDEIAIHIVGGTGYIAGVNPRSVLIATYRYLEECGVCWIRPGQDGTIYPKRCTALDVHLTEVASVRYRTICIEGAVSIEHVKDMIDWIPKLGFNGYYIQFRDAYIFFDRWYSHRENPLKEAEVFGREQSAVYFREMKQEIKKRGLLLHTVGHGWTCEPFGIENNGWDPIDVEQIPKEYKEICALVDGERKVWRDNPLATQLCYSNPEVRKTMNQGVLDYIKANPEDDIIHYWMGDYMNNTCECDECTKMPVTDYYVKLLNELDEELEKEGLKTRIAFEIGYNFAYSPEQEKLNNPDRFLMEFCPITRTFSESFPSEYTIKEIPTYKVNDFSLPRSVEENLAYVYNWKKHFQGDTVDFDYHLMWDHILDAGGEGIAKVIYDDIRNLKKLGMNGYISCQLQRNMFPTSIAMTVMGKTLWDTSITFEEIQEKLYCGAFGKENFTVMKQYFGMLSEAFDIGAMRSHKKVSHLEWEEKLVTTVEMMRDFETIIQELGQNSHNCLASSWEILELHRQIYLKVGEYLIYMLHKQQERADVALHQATQLAWEHEEELQRVLDCFFFDDVIHNKISLDRPSAFIEAQQE